MIADSKDGQSSADQSITQAAALRHDEESRRGQEEEDEAETTPTPTSRSKKIIIERKREDGQSASAKADFQMTNAFAKISPDLAATPLGTGRCPTTLTAFCVDRHGKDRDRETDSKKILAVGRKRKKDDTIFRLELYEKIGQACYSTRDIRDAFAGGAMCFLTPTVICYASWNISSGSPLIRLFDSEESQLGPSLHTQNFLRKKANQRFPGGFFQNFKGIIPFVLDESDPKTSELKLSPHVLAWSMEGLICVWELTCVTPCVKTGRLKLNYPSSHGINSRVTRQVAGRIAGKTKPADAGTLRRLDTFPKDVLQNEDTLRLRTRALGATISSCGTKIFVIDRYWRIWVWHWKINKITCIGLAPKLQEIIPFKGSPSMPGSTFRKETAKDGDLDASSLHEAGTLNTTGCVEGGFAQKAAHEWAHVPKADWVLKPKQLNIVYSDDSDVLIIGTKTGCHDDEKSRIEGAIEPSGTLWPPHWNEQRDWLISVRVETEEIVEIQEAWQPVRGPGKFIFALSDREMDPALDLDRSKKRGKRGLLLLRETDLCVVADSRTQAAFDKANIRDLETASYPPVGSQDNSKFFELQRRKTLHAESAQDEKSNSWSFNPFARPPRSGPDKFYTAFSLYCFDGLGSAALVGAFGT